MMSLKRCGVLLSALIGIVSAAPGQPFLTKINNETAIIGNDFWNVTIGRQYGTKLYYKGVDLVGEAVGHYVSYNGAQSDLNLTRPYIYQQTDDYTDIAFVATEGEFHWVLTPTLEGAYQYFVNQALPTLGEFRTLWRLANDSFTYGKTDERDEKLPPLSDFAAATKIQDETWQRADGSFITKYDFLTFLDTIENRPAVWGVYGPLGGDTSPEAEQVGSWYIHAGKDYFNGDHLKQELIVHRESATGDTVQLNMIHGTHFQALSNDSFEVGKTWGPWLWYLNNGSVEDTEARAAEESKLWPYEWMPSKNGHHSRGSVTGQVLLSDGIPASSAAVFLGDSNSEKSSLDQGAGYYYRVYVDDTGRFTIDNVRSGTYGLRVWSNGGVTGDVTTVFRKEEVVVNSGEETVLEDLTWEPQTRKELIWQVGEVDRKATGFAYSGPPHDQSRGLNCPADLTFTVGQSETSDWCFLQSKVGTWAVDFDLPAPVTSLARLSISLAGFSQGSSADILANGVKVGNITTNSIPSDPSTYRSGTLAGEWHLFQFPIKNGTLREGPNTVEFSVTKNTTYRGWIYDSILLEWV